MKAEKRLMAWYLYADGHAVFNYECRHAEAGDIQWVEIHEKLNPDLHCEFEGRIIFHRYGGLGFLKLLKRSEFIQCKVASVQAGSENTRKHGFAVGYLEIGLRGWERSQDNLHWHSLPDLIGDCWHYQPEVKEAFDPECGRWGQENVSKIIRQPQKQQMPDVQAAA